MNQETMKEQIRRFLLLPIECEKRRTTCHVVSGVLHTGQTYYSGLDEDMSNVAVGFYNVLYRHILPQGQVLFGKHLANPLFAGDTMYTFNTIANMVPEAGSTQTRRTAPDQWPDYLQNFYWQYRCLANFWLIPSDFGRRSKKYNAYDSVSIFIRDVVHPWYQAAAGAYQDYVATMPTQADFYATHCISQQAQPLAEEVQRLYRTRDAKALVAQAEAAIVQRAEAIVASPAHVAALYAYATALLPQGW